MNYYTSITLLSWLALAILCILVHENGRLSQKDKRLFYLTYSLVALSALSEWLGVQLNGNTAFPQWMLRTVKCADYILTPMAGGALAAQLRSRNIWRKLITIVLVVNTAFQFVALFTSWMLIVDEQNHYSHGPFYLVYGTLYMILFGLIIADFISYGQRFRRQNKVSIYAILVLMVTGVALQDIIGGGNRTVYIAQTLSMALLFIHTSEFSQLVADDRMQEQLIRITTDTLTGVSSRFAYSEKLRELEAAKQLPERFTAVSVDVNGLKTVNDTLGHEAGDRMICAAAQCITEALGQWGICYRTGGDEFIVLAEMPPEEISGAIALLAKKASEWHSEKVKTLHMAVGYATAAQYPGLSAEKLVHIADQAMYADKSNYYHKTGLDRRRQ